MEEYPLRWERARNIMASGSLDLLVAYADDRAVFGPAWARYFANFAVHFEPCIVLLPMRADPVLLVGPESPRYAKLHTPIQDIRVLKEFTHPDEDYPYTKIESFAEILRGLDLGSPKRIGICGRSLMNGDVYDALRASLPVEWVDADSSVSAIRAVKTPAEIAVIRYAYRIAERGLLAAIDVIAPGVVEREAAAEAEYVMRKMGAEGLGIDTFVASGPNAGPIIARTSFRKIGKDDLVLVTLAPRYEGYHAAVAIPVLLGKVSDEVRAAVKAAGEAHKICAAAMRAGMDSGVEQMGRDYMSRAGLAENFLYSGIHSIGVIEFEPPIFGPSCTSRMEKNMVLSIDVPVFDAPWGGLRVENGYLIGEAGAESLTKIPFVAEK
jgi:Xaa-Pro aminopeptidase